MNYDQRLFDRLFDNTAVLDSGCWEWLGACTPNGYGKLKYKGRTLATHRLSFVFCKGDVPADKYVCHTCDYTRCINPEHLFLGTARINKHDSMQKDRHAYGTMISKLTVDDIFTIRHLVAQGLTEQKIGELFNIKQPTVNCIKHGRVWKWLQ